MLSSAETMRGEVKVWERKIGEVEVGGIKMERVGMGGGKVAIC